MKIAMSRAAGATKSHGVSLECCRTTSSPPDGEGGPLRGPAFPEPFLVRGLREAFELPRDAIDVVRMRDEILQRRELEVAAERRRREVGAVEQEDGRARDLVMQLPGDHARNLARVDELVRRAAVRRRIDVGRVLGDDVLHEGT